MYRRVGDAPKIEQHDGASHVERRRERLRMYEYQGLWRKWRVLRIARERRIRRRGQWYLGAIINNPAPNGLPPITRRAFVPSSIVRAYGLRPR